MGLTVSILALALLAPEALTGTVQAKEIDRLDSAVQLSEPGILVAGPSEDPDHDDEQSDDSADSSGQSGSHG